MAGLNSLWKLQGLISLTVGQAGGRGSRLNSAGGGEKSGAHAVPTLEHSAARRGEEQIGVEAVSLQGHRAMSEGWGSHILVQLCSRDLGRVSSSLWTQLTEL